MVHAVKNFTVSRYLDYAVSSSIGKDGVSIDPDYKIEHLSREELVELHKALSEKQKDSVCQVLLFDIEDRILRDIARNPKKSQEYLDRLQDPILIQKIEAFCAKGSRFRKMKHRVQVRKDLPTKVVKLCLESARNQIGGVGAVLSGLCKAHKKLKHDRVYSLHPLYAKDKPAIRNCIFQGIIRHRYDGIDVESSIYKDRETCEYLIQPDPKYCDIFNIPPKDGVYLPTLNCNYTSHERSFYCGAAAAAFANLYWGKSKRKRVHIVHCDSSWMSGSAFPLIAQVNQMRRFPIKTIFTAHSHQLCEFMHMTGKRLQEIGIDSKESLVEMIGFGMKHADRVVTVSSRIGSEMLSSDPSLSLGQDQNLQPQEKVIAIRNGVDAENFDVTNAETFKELALQRTFDKQGNEITDYVQYRSKLKQMLFEAGLIADPSLPLVFFIGRYVKEKGMDILVDVVRNTNPSTAQFVTMGIGQNHLIHQLQGMAKSKKVRCYTEKEQQTAKFKDTSLSIGQMMRAAADICIVPSHAEACGLVAMEAQCAGSFVVAPYHQGLTDICKPEGYPNGEGVYRLAKDANSVCYRDHNDFKQARAALSKALTLWGKMTDAERNQVACRIHNEALSNYSWYYHDQKENVITGASVAYHNLYEELANTPKKIEKQGPLLKAPVQAPIVPVPVTSSRFSRAIKRITLCVRSFFYYVAERSCSGYLSLKGKLRRLAQRISTLRSRPVWLPFRGAAKVSV